MTSNSKTLFGDMKELTIIGANLNVSNASNEEEEVEVLRKKLFKKIVESPRAFFKSQQKDDPDLTDEEKLSIVENLHNQNIKLFLERYGNYFTVNDLPYLDYIPSHDDPILDTQKRILIKRFSQNPSCKSSNNRHRKSQLVVKNRRYEKMMRLEREGDYFSEEEMKVRNPLMYHEMVGRYLNDDEINIRSKSQVKKYAVQTLTSALNPALDNNSKSNNNDETSNNNNNDNMLQLSSLLLEHLQAMQNNELYDRQLELEQCCTEETEDDDEDEDEEEDNLMESHNASGKTNAEEISEVDKLFLRNEFLSNMRCNFLDGKDDFDYDEVDNDSTLDDLKVMDMEAEEEYFDGDDDDDDDDNDGEREVDDDDDNEGGYDGLKKKCNEIDKDVYDY